MAIASLLVLAACAEMPAPKQPDELPAGPHEPLEVRRGKLFTASGREARPLENVSAYCVECHADDLGGAGDHGAPMMRSHPVEIGYDAADGDGLVARDEIDPRLLLLDGKVTCVTCHDARTTDHRLVMPDDQSQLCLECHRR
jgi:predicted CXXCH cytochrome family protein